jgi:putative endonuclease
VKRAQSNLAPASLVGREGESLAAFCLLQKGYTIITQNQHFGRIGEIDILAVDPTSDEVVLVEVKTVVGVIDPVQRIDWAKQRKLRLLAEIVQERYPNRNVRIDCITISQVRTHPHITHLENILQ